MPIQQPVQPVNVSSQIPVQPVQQAQPVQQPVQPVPTGMVQQPLFKSPKQMAIEFFSGFFVVWLVLIFQAWATRSQFGGMIFDVQVALTISLILSIVLLLAYIGLVIAFIFTWKKPLVIIGSLVGFPLIYLLSAGVREGFQIFFAFI